jgi:hypothetical protein
MDAPRGGLVCATTGVSEAIKVGTNVAVMKGIGVKVAIWGVALAAPTTIGVAVNIDGVWVGGKNGVGGL